jgi:hypothetical protein
MQTKRVAGIGEAKVGDVEAAGVGHAGAWLMVNDRWLIARADASANNQRLFRETRIYTAEAGTPQRMCF